VQTPTTRFAVLVTLTTLIAACGGESSPAPGAGGTGATGGASGGSGGTGGSTGGTGGSTGGTGGSTGGTGGSTGGKGGTGGTGGSTGGTGGSTSGTGGGSGAGGVPFDDAPTELAGAVCAKAFECCTEEELAAIAIVGSSETQCRLAVATLLQLYSADIETSVEAGRAAYDGEAVAGCIAAQEGRACDDLPSFGEIGCAGAVVPLVPIGDACGAHNECMDGGYCDGATQVASPTGTCAEKKADGEACTIAEECEGGACDTAAGCGPTDDTPICGG